MNLSQPTWNSTQASLRWKSNRHNFSISASFFGFMLIGLLFLGGCNDASNLNSSVFDGDDLKIEVEEDFNISVKTIQRRPQLMYSDGSISPITHLIGQMSDPIFGSTIAETYSQLDFATTLGGNPFDGFQIDSILITLLYDTTAVYGDFSQEVTLDVYEIQEFLDEVEIYNSNDQFQSDKANPITSYTFTPQPFDSVNVEIGDTVLKVSPRIVFPIENDAFKQRLIEADSALWADPDSFRTVFNGFHFAYDENTSANSILGFNFRAETITQMRIEYFNPDSTDDRRNFIFTFGGDVNNNPSSSLIRTTYFKHDHSQGELANALADSNVTATDTITFLQEMQGVSPKITISGLSKLHGSAINSAELTLTVNELGNDPMLHLPEPNLITIEQVQGDSLFIDIVDTDFAKRQAARSNSLLGYVATFGGLKTTTSDTSQNKYIYTAAITSHLQDVIDRGQDETTIYISSFYQPERPRRVVLNGSSRENPVKLVVRYTKV